MSSTKRANRKEYYCKLCSKPFQKESFPKHFKSKHKGKSYEEIGHGHPVLPKSQTTLSFGGKQQPSSSSSVTTPTHTDCSPDTTKRHLPASEEDEPLAKRLRATPKSSTDLDPSTAFNLRQFLELQVANQNKLQTTVDDLITQNKRLAGEISRLSQANDEKEQLGRAMGETMRRSKWATFSADRSRAWCKPCMKWCHVTAKGGKQRSSPWIADGFDMSKISSKSPNEQFDCHESSNMHRESVQLNNSQQSLWELQQKSPAFNPTQNLVRIIYQLSQMHMSDASYESFCYLLHVLGVNIGDWQHSRFASRDMKLNISDGMKEKESRFFETDNPATQQPPLFGYSDDEVSTHKTTFACQQLQTLVNGRPKAMFLRAQELTEVSINNAVLTKYAIENICSAAGISPGDLKERLTGTAFDGASVYSGPNNSVSANLTKYNPHLQKQHDRMHAIQLPLKDGCKKYSQYQGVLDLVSDIYAYTSHSHKKHREMQRVFTELHELSKQADLRRRRANLIADDELKRAEPDHNDEKSDDNSADPIAVEAFKRSLRPRMRKLLKVFKIRMVAASHKALTAIYVDYEMLVKFFREEVLNEKDAGKLDSARKILRKLVRHGFVAQFLSFMDITHTLSKHSCNSQNDVLTVLELEHLNTEMFDDLTLLSDSKIEGSNKFRFGKTLKKHAAELWEGKFKGITLCYKPNTRDCLAPVRKLQSGFCNFLLSKYKIALELTPFQKAAQIFVPANAIAASAEKRQADLAAVLKVVGHFVKSPDKCNRQFLRLIRLLEQQYSARKMSEVLDVYEEIFTNPAKYDKLESILRVIEAILTMSLSSVGNERAGRTLAQTLTSERSSQKADIVDAQLRISINGCQLHDLDVKHYTKRWLNNHHAATKVRGTQPSSVIERLSKLKSKLNIY